VDDEGVRAKKVPWWKMELKTLLNVAPARNDSDQSNGHGRSGFFDRCQATMRICFLLYGNGFGGGVEEEISGCLRAEKLATA